MTKKFFQWMLMATLTVGLGWSVTSCKDDDDDNNKSEQEQEETKEKADNFWDVVGQLTSMDNYTEDYADKTFEPTIGEPSDGNANVRIVATNDMATAAQRFADLVNVSISENTPSYEYSNENVGTLKYTKTTDGTSLATVDVDIRQLPSLQQIVYKTPEQMGTNGVFKGSAYYRFGDVVSKKNGDNTEYWVCVRPAFGPESKGDTHWVTVCPLPAKNIWTYTASNKALYTLPTGIGTNKEKMQLFAELIYAITHPDKWYGNVRSNSRMPMFSDFHPANVHYHNNQFWKEVCQNWKDKDVWKVMFGLDYDSEDQMRNSIDNYGLNLLYKGYSWWKSVSWNLTLYEASFKNSNDVNKKNLHNVKYREVEHNVRDIKDLNLQEQYANGRYYLQSASFFGPGPRFVVRYATGKELCGSNPNVYSSMVNQTNGLKDFYVYNKVEDIAVGPEKEAIVSKKDPSVGDLLCDDGQCYTTKADADSAQVTPVGLVVYYHRYEGIWEKEVAYDEVYSALAIALKDIDEDVAWVSAASPNRDSFHATCATQVDYPFGGLIVLNSIDNNSDGLEWTISQKNKCGNNHVHPASLRCYEKSDIAANARKWYGLSSWFLPSSGQMISAFSQWNEFWNGSFKDANLAWEKINNGIRTAYAACDGFNGEYWVNTLVDKDSAYVLKMKSRENVEFVPKDKSTPCKVRPFIYIE